MASIALLIPDASLRTAVAEQLSLAGFEDARENGDSTEALIVDEAAADKKFLKTLHAAAAAGDKKPVFLLGKLEGDGGEFVTENFAKPLRLGHLLARLQFHLQVAPRLRNTPVIFGPYCLETQNRQITVSGADTAIRLTEKETALVAYLGQSDQPVSREELLAAIWGYDARIDTHTLETHIYQLRRKLDAEGKGTEWLINEGGAYRLRR